MVVENVEVPMAERVPLKVSDGTPSMLTFKFWIFAVWIVVEEIVVEARVVVPITEKVPATVSFPRL